MPKILLRYFILLITLNCLTLTVQAQNQNCLSCHTSSELNELRSLLKPGSIEERGLGIMNKGQIANYLGNYGVLSNRLIHVMTRALICLHKGRFPHNWFERNVNIFVLSVIFFFSYITYKVVSNVV